MWKKWKIVNRNNLYRTCIWNIINNLQLINAIEVRNNTFRINFPVFLEDDVMKMEGYLSNIGQVIWDKIISLGNIINDKLSNLECAKYRSKERILYHIICDKIFDGGYRLMLQKGFGVMN